MRIRLEPYKRKKPVCSYCGKIHKEKYCGKNKEIIIRDLDIGEKKVYLHISRRKYHCPKDGRIHVEDIPWVKLRTRVTKRFAIKVYRLTAITTNQKAGWYLDMDDETVYRIDKEILEDKAKEKLTPPPTAVNISVDEVSYRKYHRYLTNVIDVDKRLVILE